MAGESEQNALRLEKALVELTAHRRRENAHPAFGGGGDGEVWEALRRIDLSQKQSDRSRLVSYSRVDRAYMQFDMLRTRLQQAFAERGWRRVAVTSPSKGCGKSFVAANLALSLARQKGRRVALVDMDLREPSLAPLLGVRGVGSIEAWFDGLVALEDHFCRLGGSRMALGLNVARLVSPSETLQDVTTIRALREMEARLDPEVVIYDTPPMLVFDDLMTLLPQVDCVLMVAGGGVTKASDLRRCAKLLEDRAPILGIALNRAEEPSQGGYSY